MSDLERILAQEAQPGDTIHLQGRGRLSVVLSFRGQDKRSPSSLFTYDPTWVLQGEDPTGRLVTFRMHPATFVFRERVA